MVYDHAENVNARWKYDGIAENVKIQCDGTECEYIWVMKWINGNSVMTLNVNAYEWWYEIMITVWWHCWKCEWKTENYENSVMALNVNTYE